jgi:hypothetical protein
MGNDFNTELTSKQKLVNLLQANVSDVLDVVEAHAKEFYDGHYTVMAFTTGVKAMFGTVDLDTGYGRYDLLALPAYPDAHIAMSHMLAFDKNYCVVSA